MISEKLKLDVDMKDDADLTWQHAKDNIKIKLMNTDINLNLSLSKETIRQLKQALSRY